MPSSDAIGQALVDFAANGLFPDEDASLFTLSSDKLPGAIQALADKKSHLEGEIHTINEETADDVSTWFNNAKLLQDDINRSKILANDILKQADTPDISGRKIREAEEKADFLVRELNYNQSVRHALNGIKRVSHILDQAEQATSERRILDALRLLEKSWSEMDTIPVSKSCRAMRLLDIRAFELKSDVHQVFERVWHALVNVDVENGRLSIIETREGESMDLSDAVIGLKAYKEIDDRMIQLWHDLDRAIVRPRTDIENQTLPAIYVEEGALELKGVAGRDVNALFTDLGQIISFLATRLPTDLVQSISTVMMPELMSRVIDIWLDSAVPASLADMDAFEGIISTAGDFCQRLAELKFTGFSDLQEWVDGAPRVWLSKCRETALDTVRTKLSQGLGEPKQVERVEKQMVSRAEGKQLTANDPSATADNQDWNTAWSDKDDASADAPPAPTQIAQEPNEGDDDGSDAWGAWANDEEPQEDPVQQKEKDQTDQENPDDDPSEAWGWGEEDNTKEEVVTASKKVEKLSVLDSATREMTLKETYNISSMPEPVLALISTILEDGAALTSDDQRSSPVAAAAAGLFSLPTLALAMFRAISPYYYAMDMGGNMFLYNDTSYLAERLADLSMKWKAREDLSMRARNMLRLENDVKALQSFANRAYSNEMSIQKTILRDLLGGSQNIVQQDDADAFIDAAISRVQTMATVWESILTRSTWYQAVGSLVDSVSIKMVTDVMELPSIGQEEAFNIASLIARTSALDDLFLSSRAQGTQPEADEIPSTAQYASSWLRLQYLSQVLQSNLREVRYLWMESELSLYFTPDEVVDLINLSFEDNAKSREVAREITQNPQPVQL